MFVIKRIWQMLSAFHFNAVADDRARKAYNVDTRRKSYQRNTVIKCKKIFAPKIEISYEGRRCQRRHIALINLVKTILILG